MKPRELLTGLPGDPTDAPIATSKRAAAGGEEGEEDRGGRRH